MATSVVGLFDEKTNIDTVIRDLERIGVPRRHVHALAGVSRGTRRRAS